MRKGKTPDSAASSKAKPAKKAMNPAKTGAAKKEPQQASKSSNKATAAMSGVGQRTATTAAVPPSASNGTMSKVDERIYLLVQKVYETVVGKLPRTAIGERDTAARLVQGTIDEALQDEGPLEEQLRATVIEETTNEVYGYGPLQRLLDDPDISEIAVDGIHRVFVERRGRIVESGVRFRDDAHILNIIDRIVRPMGHIVDHKRPMVTGRLADGSHFHAVIPPISLSGPCITIRKFRRDHVTFDDFLRLGATSPEAASCLESAIKSRVNILVSGGTSCGKTTTINVLSAMIPPDERVISIERTADYQLRHERLVRLETRPPNIEGEGEVNMAQLIRSAALMRAERLVLGEFSGPEVLEALQVISTGHDGSITTVHANTVEDALQRLERMCMMSGQQLGLNQIQEVIAGTIQVIVQQTRLRDATRKITQITELRGLEHGRYVLQPLFRYRIDGVAEDGRIRGAHEATGVKPSWEEGT